jgi:lipopolysaccharide/colanic/teichoic acid biosynthesis glycosyltransferase
MLASLPTTPRKICRRVSGPYRSLRHILSEELFRDVLARECRGAERFDQPITLMRVGLDTRSGQSPQPWWNVIESIAASTSGTAVIGWQKDQAVLGAILPNSRGHNLEGGVRRELAKRLTAETVARVRIGTQVYPCTTPALEGEPWKDPFLDRQRLPDTRRVLSDGLKRGLDIAGSLALLFILAPIFVAIAALLKLTSPGPILFRQPRIGQFAKSFTMLKFRTMRVDADPSVHHAFVTGFIKSGAQLHSAGRKAVFKLTNDPRVTPVGRILRKTSLDELPQLWNVLRGEMSLVGPRPPLAYEVEQYLPWHRRRVIDAKPGITGLWQVSGRSRTTFDQMVRLDLQYARTRSLWTDIKILLATPRAVISGKGAE